MKDAYSFHATDEDARSRVRGDVRRLLPHLRALRPRLPRGRGRHRRHRRLDVARVHGAGRHRRGRDRLAATPATTPPTSRRPRPARRGRRRGGSRRARVAEGADPGQAAPSRTSRASSRSRRSELVKTLIYETEKRLVAALRPRRPRGQRDQAARTHSTSTELALASEATVARRPARRSASPARSASRTSRSSSTAERRGHDQLRHRRQRGGPPPHRRQLRRATSTRPTVDRSRVGGAGDRLPALRRPLQAFRGIEVGHIFNLGTKYSRAMKCDFLDERRQEQADGHGLLRRRRRRASSPPPSSRTTTRTASSGRCRSRRSRCC